MKTTITDISSTEIVERLNSWTLENRSSDDYLTRLYMEDGQHYEDEYPKIIHLLKEEANRRGLTSKPASALIPGDIIKTAWWGNMVVMEAHTGGPDGGYACVLGDVNYTFPYEKNFRMKEFYFLEPRVIVE
ncbi:MAG: hypothetical protein NC489_11550 [Ruminococcus flavefaciens]|nr:hypothetical protein [Ruminococcus flavefaciens]